MPAKTLRTVNQFNVLFYIFVVFVDLLSSYFFFSFALLSTSYVNKMLISIVL